MNELPPGWAITTISDITAYLSRGKQPKYTSFSNLPVINQRAIRWFGIQNEYLKYVDPIQFDQWESERFIQAGDILWNSTGTGTLGRACLVKPHDLEPPKVVDSHVTIVRVNQTAVEPRFLFSWIQSSEVQENIASLATGATNQIELSRATIASMRIPIAPLKEQKRIADKLNSLLARVDACRDRLDRVSLILKRFRQSVLNAAAAGELTENWRSNLQENEPENLDRLSVDWQICVLTEIAEVIDPNPKHRNPKYFQSGFPFLSTAQFGEIDGWDLTQVKYVNEETVIEQEARCNFRDGSLAFSRKGTIGKVRKLPTDIRFALLDSVCVINPLNNQNSDYLKIVLEAEFVQEQVSKLTRGVALKQVSVGDVRSLQILLPSLDEQYEIVRRVRTLLAFVNACQARYQNALTRVQQLTPTLLSKAFRGELVPQDLNDEPASVLLDRICAERAAQPVKPKRVVTRRKSTMIKMSNESVKEAIHQLSKNRFSFDELEGELSKKLTGDYDLLKDILFALLDETEPSIMQTFDQETKAMRLIRRHQ